MKHLPTQSEPKTWLNLAIAIILKKAENDKRSSIYLQSLGEVIRSAWYSWARK